MNKPAFQAEDLPQQSTPRKRKTPSSLEKNSSRTPQNRQAMTNAAPLYITVGPQCCGKSSLLKTLDGGKVKDISLDDQPDVYVPVPTDIFLSCFADKTVTQDVPELLQQVYQGRTLQERIRNDNREIHLILQRWAGDITREEFESAVREFYISRGFGLEVAQQLVTAVEQSLNNKVAPSSKPQLLLPKMIDVFILESLFQPHPDTKQSGIQKAHQELRTTPKHIPIAWGNTNAKSRDYSQALEIACQTRRPVRFVICHPALTNEKEPSQAAIDAKLLTLPWVSLSDLLKRNLKRLQETGRYIPAFAISDCCSRVQSLVTINRVEGIDTVEQRLVSLASPSFVNGNNGRRPQQQRHTPTFEYVLTEHRLIQKIYPQIQQGRANGNRRSNRF
ncbi:hypothetical protein IV203_016202 [Nitzschia inconspicua]|uniref:Uncharacterized protein n=1 Tax=Nitzschia inconspicua TaxID=303405 RepID=A0A9K3KPU7_9STRA|nr:hypothetical protein IV203_016202 [Nitzschia inconspicua]